ncbi:MAG: head GIN domain-containing protein [Bacteroidota bacterium]
MAKFIQISIFLLSAFFINSCGVFKSIDGSGNIVRQERVLSGYEKIKIDNSFNVFIEKSNSFGVIVETDDNIQPHIKTEIEDKRLNIYNDESIDPTSTIITIKLPLLKDLLVNGTAIVRGRGVFTGEELEITLNSSGDVEIETELQKIELEINGSGDITARGKADEADLEIDGSGDLQLLNLDTREVKAEINGSGNITVKVSEKLQAKIDGSGNILYYGDPGRVVSDISGSGSVMPAR